MMKIGFNAWKNYSLCSANAIHCEAAEGATIRNRDWDEANDYKRKHRRKQHKHAMDILREKQRKKVHTYRCKEQNVCDCKAVEQDIYQDLLDTYTGAGNPVLSLNRHHLAYRRQYLRRIFESCFQEEIAAIEAAIAAPQTEVRKYKTPTHPCAVCKAAGRAAVDYENVMVSQIQTRSADESMTLEMTCMTCGKQWHRAGWS